MTSYVATLRISYKLRGHYLLQAESNVVYLPTNVPSHLLFFEYPYAVAIDFRRDPRYVTLG
jgi:hypothetical protein